MRGIVTNEIDASTIQAHVARMYYVLTQEHVLLHRRQHEFFPSHASEWWDGRVAGNRVARPIKCYMVTALDQTASLSHWRLSRNEIRS